MNENIQRFAEIEIKKYLEMLGSDHPYEPMDTTIGELYKIIVGAEQ